MREDVYAFCGRQATGLGGFVVGHKVSLGTELIRGGRPISGRAQSADFDRSGR